MKLFNKLEKNIEEIENIFSECQDIVKRKLSINEKNPINIYIVYVDMLTNRELFEESILVPLMYHLEENIKEKDVFASLLKSSFATADVDTCNDFEKVTLQVLSGDTVIFLEDCSNAFVISTKGWPNRGIQSAETEVVIEGSKEAFSEVFRFNTALIRRRIKDPKLKLKQIKVGQRSETDLGIMYMEDLVRKDILDEVLSRIEKINIDAIMDAGYIEQFIEDNWYSPFPQVQLTERPDKTASALLEGRISVIVDNSPFVLLIPATFNVFFQSSEDYYQSFSIMSFVRVIRYVAGFLAYSLPGLYLAIALYHPSMISFDLIMKMKEARYAVPLPGLFEVLLMDLSFELLREGGIRLPSPIGSTIGIVGGLIIGQAAVEAGLVSPIVVILVAFTAVSTFAIPNTAMVNAFRLSKYIIMFLSAFMGIFGFCIGQILILIHLSSLKSFNIPYMFPFVSSELNGYSDLKDTIFRFPIFSMKKRPFFTNPKGNTRLTDIGNNHNKE